MAGGPGVHRELVCDRGFLPAMACLTVSRTNCVILDTLRLGASLSPLIGLMGLSGQVRETACGAYLTR